MTAPNAAVLLYKYFYCTLKYKMLVLVHPQSAENVRLQWGFLTILYKYIIQQYLLYKYLYRTPQQYFTVTAPNTAFTKYLKQNIKCW